MGTVTFSLCPFFLPASCVTDLRNIELYSLGYNSIGKRGAAAIADALMHNKTLKKLK